MGEVMQQAGKQNTPIIKNCKWKKSIEICAYYTPNTPYCRGTQSIPQRGI